ncbi:MAG: zinc-ribbon domain-containing protein [Candidatus Bathyarchaeota archaeon]|nr:zinc-ribbon domain-containing protein [Candidatus Bathyarchaeota archaeon]
MSHCQKCGVILDENARFCQVCGAPVEKATANPAKPVSTKRRAKAPYIIPVVALIAVLVVALVLAVSAVVPVRPVDFSQTEIAAEVPGVDTVNVNFNADVAEVHVIPADLPNQLVKLEVSATGGTGLFNSDEQPVEVTFSNETADNVMTVTSNVTRTEMWPISFNLKVDCDLYVDYSVVLNINATTSVGDVILNNQGPFMVTYQDLNLRSTTGNVKANLTDNVGLTRDISVSTTTGSVELVWDNVSFFENLGVNLQTTTGSVTTNVTHNDGFEGNVSINAETTTGSVNVNMNISGDVGAQISSHSSTGSIFAEVQGFNGNRSPIYSSNFPAAINFLVDAETTTGSIHIAAAYQNGDSEVPVQEQVRDAVITYIECYHPETAQYMQSLSWSGGRETPEGLDGAETYSYVSDGWNVTIHYPVIPNPIYTVMAVFSDENITIRWEGTYQNGDITETHYSFTGQMETPEQVRDAVMTYIEINHEETAPYMQDLQWTGGRVDTGLIGAEKYVYTTEHGMLGGAWWTVEINYPVVPNPIYTVTVNYTQIGVLSPYEVFWNGTWQDGVVTETGYSTNLPSLQEQIRDEVMAYIKAEHVETDQYMQDLNWTGGRVDTGLLGAEKYVYTTLMPIPGGAGWTVTIDYPVVPNPIYTVSANYTQTGVQFPVEITWKGTWENGTITETSYMSNINEETTEEPTPTTPVPTTPTSTPTATPTTTPTPSPTPPEPTTPPQEQVRDDVMSYIQAVHVETDQFLQNLQWTGGKVDTGLLGAEEYVYTTEHGMIGGAWWTVEIHNPVVPNPLYTVTANYTQTGVQTPNEVVWEGTLQNGVVNETSYTSNIPVTQEQIRDSVMNYIKINHEETAQFMQNLDWTGGKVDTGFLGSELYTYISGGWNFTMTYPVVPDPIYTITADYQAQGIGIPYRVLWTGTWQNGTTVETDYTFAQ